MDLEYLKNVLRNQKSELAEFFSMHKMISRDVPSLSKFLSAPNILAILGVRRSGKSTLSSMLLGDKKFGYINFDDERLAGITSSELNMALQAIYEIEGSDVEYLLLDEPQNVKGWELFATRLRTTKRVVLTGSNADMLTGELATHLTGRHIPFTLFPFSLGEFLAIKGISQSTSSTQDIAGLKRGFEEYLASGGFPEYHLFGKSIVSSIYSDIIQKDIIARHRIYNQTTFRELARYLVSNVGHEITYSKLRNISRIKNVHTVKNYIKYMQDSYLLFVIERFSFKLKEQTLAPKKVYCIDNGIVSSVGFSAIKNTSAIMENLVAIELRRRSSYLQNAYEVFYWKDHAQNEVDFVTHGKEGVMQLIQVTVASSHADLRERETTALLKASKELRCNNLLVITWDLEDVAETGGKRIAYIPIWKWLLKR